MKRIMMIGLSFLLLLSFSACGNKLSETGTTGNETESSADIEAETQNKTIGAAEPEIQESEETEGKTLIAYFSLIQIVPDGADAVTHATPTIGNTEAAALEIQRQVGGELFAIQTVESYPISHSECSAIAEEEMRSDARPELSTHVENMDDYNTVYIGFPIWWYQEPMAIHTFLEEYDFSGKTIIPFCTTLGAGVEESEEHIKSFCPDATVLSGLTLRTGQNDLSEPVAEWLGELGLIE